MSQNHYPAITNQFSLSNGQKMEMNPSGANNNFGNYFQKCTAPSAYWGSSNGPVQDQCLTPQKGQPCHNVWNNNTKRKMIVDYQR